MNINYSKTLLHYLIIIVITAIIKYFIHLEPDKFLFVTIILLFSILKIAFFYQSIFKKLIIVTKDVQYFSFLIFICFNVIYLIFSFSLDYFLIYSLDPLSFTGIEGADNIYEVYFKFFYLSFLLFTNMGVANVIPVAIPAEALVMLEAISSFATIIFVLSDFVSLKESFQYLRSKGKQ